MPITIDMFIEVKEMLCYIINCDCVQYFGDVVLSHLVTDV